MARDTRKTKKSRWKGVKAPTPAIPTKASSYPRRKAKQCKLFSDEDKRYLKKACTSERPATVDMPCEDLQIGAAPNSCSKHPKKDESSRLEFAGIDEIIEGRFSHKGLKSGNEEKEDKKGPDHIHSYKVRIGKKYHILTLRELRKKVQRKFAHTLAVCTCETVPTYKMNPDSDDCVDLYLSGRGPSWTRMATCKFAFCQICGPKLVEKRQAIIAAGLQVAELSGFPSYLSTNTLERSGCCETQYILLARGRGKLRTKLDHHLRAKRGLGYAYYMAVDPTFDENNVKGNFFHLHIHGVWVVYSLDPQKTVADIIDEDELYDLMTRLNCEAWCEATTGKPEGQDFQRIKDVNASAGYLAKGAGGGKEDRYRKTSLEVAGSIYKKGKKGKSLPQLMDCILSGDDRCIPIYQEFMQTMAGKNSVSPSRNWKRLMTNTLYDEVAGEPEEPTLDDGEPVLSINSFWFKIIGAGRLSRVGLSLWKHGYVDDSDKALESLRSLLDKTVSDLEKDYGVLLFPHRPPDDPLKWQAFVEEKGVFVWDGRVYYLGSNGKQQHKGIFEYAFDEWFLAYSDPVLEHSLRGLDALFDELGICPLEPVDS